MFGRKNTVNSWQNCNENENPTSIMRCSRRTMVFDEFEKFAIFYVLHTAVIPSPAAAATTGGGKRKRGCYIR
jgi:hypothetical protein